MQNRGNATTGKKYIICAIMSIAFAIVVFHRVSPAVFVDRLILDLNIGSAAIAGFLSSIYFYIYALLQVPTGIMCDTAGARKTVFAGLILTGAASVFFGLSTTLGQVYFARLLIGAGVAVIYICALKLYSEWFDRKQFATIIGLTVFIGNLGGVLAGTPFAVMIEHMGWRYSFVLIGLATIIIGILAVFLIQDHPRKPAFPKTPGLDKSKSSSRYWNNLGPTFKEITADKNLWLALTAACCIYGPFMALSGIWGVPYLMHVYSLDNTTAAGYIMFCPIGFMFGSIILGNFSDRIQSRKIPYLISAAGCLLVWALIFYWNYGQLPVYYFYPFFLMLGFFSASSLFTSILAKEYNRQEIAGTASSIGNMGSFLGAALMQPFFGYILDRCWEGAFIDGAKAYPPSAFHAAFAVCMLTCFLGLCVIALLKDSLRTGVKAQKLEVSG